MGEVIWVMFKARHGGGHQGRTTEYKPYLYGIEEDNLDYELEDWCRQFNNVKATAEILDFLPPDIIQQKLHEHTCSIQYHNHIMLSLTGEPNGS